MKQYAGWQAPFYSFWSKSFYVDVAKSWSGLAYAYLFVLLCFTWLFMSAKIEMEFAYNADHVMKPVIEQLPVMTINKGILSIDHPSPYTIKGTSGEPFIIFDTRDKPLKSSEASCLFLVEKNTVIFKPSEADKLMIEHGKESGMYRQPSPDQNMDLFSTVDQAVIDQKALVQAIGIFKKIFAIFIFVIGLPLGFILCALQSLFYGLLAMAIVNANKVNLTYGACVRLSVVAMTPVLLLDSLLKLRNANSVFWGPIALVITVGYIMFAVRAVMDDPGQKSQSTVT
jgi:Protein of unknown function (DUF1189)